MPGRRRGSATTPAIADAAAVSGEARNVRPPLPWRPSKFRFDVLTAYWPGDSWSPFIAMHIEQPASRQSAPAARKISCEALALGLALHLVGAGHDHHPDAVGDVPALERRGGEAQVADPAVRARADEHDVDLLAEDRLARAGGPCTRAPARGRAGAGRPRRRPGRARWREIGRPMPGFVP